MVRERLPAWRAHAEDVEDSFRGGGATGQLALRELIGHTIRSYMAHTCNSVFDEVDHDNSGRLNSAEVHVAVLLVYDKLNHHLGGAQLPVPSALEVKQMTLNSDKNGDRQLSRREFRNVFAERFLHRVTARVMARILVSRLLVPAAAIGLHVLEEKRGWDHAVEDNLGRWAVRSAEILSQGQSRASRRDVQATRQLTETAVSRLLPIANYHLARELAKLLRVETLFSWIFGERRLHQTRKRRKRGKA